MDSGYGMNNWQKMGITLGFVEITKYVSRKAPLQK